MARRRACKQRPNSLNCLPSAANYAANISPAELQFEDGRPTAWNFRQHHIIRKLYELPDDELEKLSHEITRLITNRPSHNTMASQVNVNKHEFSFTARDDCSLRLARENFRSCPQRITSSMEDWEMR